MFSWITSRFAGRKDKKKNIQSAKRLYAAIVAQARQPFFYRELKIADTIPGRLEMVSLHMFIILDRLTGKGAPLDEIAQELVDVMFQDMDDVARETGVGDMGVAPRIKKLARSFRSRLEYYKQSIEGDGKGNFPRGTLPEALLEIHFQEDETKKNHADMLADYVTACQKRVNSFSLEELLASAQPFCDPEKPARETKT